VNQPVKSKNVKLEIPTKDEVFELQMKFKKDLKKMLKDTSIFPEELIYIGRNINLGNLDNQSEIN
jgi:hypothetical protein